MWHRGGHNAAAHAVCEECLRRGHDATFLELYDLRSRRLTHGSSHVYVWSVRHKAVFKGLYHLGDSVSRHLSVMSPVYHFNAVSSDKLGECIDGGGFDVVVTPHLFAGEALTALRAMGRLLGYLWWAWRPITLAFPSGARRGLTATSYLTQTAWTISSHTV